VDVHLRLAYVVTRQRSGTQRETGCAVQRAERIGVTQIQRRVGARGLQDLGQRQGPEILAVATADHGLVVQPPGESEPRAEVLIVARDEAVRQTRLTGGLPSSPALGPRGQ